MPTVIDQPRCHEDEAADLQRARDFADDRNADQTDKAGTMAGNSTARLTPRRRPPGRRRPW